MQPHQTLQSHDSTPAGLAQPAPRRRHRKNRHQRPTQIPLPLPLDGWNENELRIAHRAARVRMSFEVAMRSPAMAICLKCLTEAQHRQTKARPAKACASVQSC